MTTTYSTGTISVGAGSTTVTGVGTAWTTSGIRAGDRLETAGLGARIASIDSATQLTLARAWPGAGVSGVNYDIWLVFDDDRVLVAANALLAKLTGGTLTSLGGLSGAANRTPYWTGAGVMAETDLTALGRALAALTPGAAGQYALITGAGTAVLKNILGTVTQASGKPTGALIERGSTVNGEYAKFADGTMICTSPDLPSGAITSALGAGYVSANVTWTFPATFIAAPNVPAAQGGNTGVWAGVNPASTTAVVMKALALSGIGGGVNLRAVAFGRWF